MTVCVTLYSCGLTYVSASHISGWMIWNTLDNAMVVPRYVWVGASPKLLVQQTTCNNTGTGVSSHFFDVGVSVGHTSPTVSLHCWGTVDHSQTLDVTMASHPNLKYVKYIKLNNLNSLFLICLHHFLHFFSFLH